LNSSRTRRMSTRSCVGVRSSCTFFG
jgi:hypothetical protein